MIFCARATRGLRRMGGEPPDYPSCSQNAHDEAVLVRCAQWKINQPPPPHYPPHTTMDQPGHEQYSVRTVRSLSDIDRPIAAADPQPFASFSALKSPQRIPANTPPVFPDLRPRVWPHCLRLVTKAMSDRLLAHAFHRLLRWDIIWTCDLFSFPLGSRELPKSI
jgi:hypothetical protein